MLVRHGPMPLQVEDVPDYLDVNVQKVHVNEVQLRYRTERVVMVVDGPEWCPGMVPIHCVLTPW